MFQANIVPGQGFQKLTVYETKGGVSETGRAMTGTPQPTDKTFYGIITSANQKEIDQWKQEGHPITHKITEYSAMKKAKAHDYVVADDGREFYVQGAKNPAGLGVTMIYYVEERLDIKKKEPVK